MLLPISAADFEFEFPIMGEEDKKPQHTEMDVKEPKPTQKSPPENNDKKTEQPKDANDAPPPPPPQILLKVYMHCEGCARKVRRCLRGFEGVEDVITDCKSHKVIVKGEKADPLKVLARVQRKSHRNVELLSPIPIPPPPEKPTPPEEKEKPKTEDKIEEPQLVTVVLSVHMHCEGCAQEIKKRILRMKGVESVEPDLKGSQVSVTGNFDPPQLVDYVHRRTGKHVVMVKSDPEKKEKVAEVKEVKEEKANEEGEKEKKGGGGDGDGKQSVKEVDGGGGEAKVAGGAAVAAEVAVAEESKAVELIKNEYQFYPQRYAMEMYAYPPQIFSDENPNACSVM